MAGPTVTSEGSTLADGTEQFLGPFAGSKYYQFSVDTTPMQSGDTLEVRWYKKVNSGGTIHRFQVETYSGDQTVEPLSPVKDSGPFWIANSCDLSIKQTAGTNRTYNWEVLEP